MNHQERVPAPDLIGMTRVLIEHEVEFVVIGGYAVAFQGYPRATKDVDIVPEPSDANLGRLWDALSSLESRPLALAEFGADERPLPFSLESIREGGGNWLLATNRGRLDVMQWVSGIESYRELRAHADEVTLEDAGGSIWIAGFNELLAMKEAAGRDQDLIDITALRMARGEEA
jgi:hypothetical protein